MFLLYSITVEIRHNMYEVLCDLHFTTTAAAQPWKPMWWSSLGTIVELMLMPLTADTGCYYISKALTTATIFHFMYNLPWFLNTFILQQWKTLLQYQTKIQWAVLTDSFFHRRL